MAVRPRRGGGTAGDACLRQHRPDGKTCAFCPDRLVGKPDHRDPRFLVRSLCARSHRLGAVGLKGYGRVLAQPTRPPAIHLIASWVPALPSINTLKKNLN